MCAECVVTGTLFSMQTRIAALRHEGIFEDVYFSYNIIVLIQVQFRSHITQITRMRLCVLWWSPVEMQLIKLVLYIVSNNVRCVFSC